MSAIYEVPIQAVPSQRMSFQVGADNVQMRIKILQGLTGIYVDVVVNTIDVVIGARVKDSVNILENVQHLLVESDLKTLMFIKNNDKEHIDYNDFSNSVKLYYTTSFINVHDALIAHVQQRS